MFEAVFPSVLIFVVGRLSPVPWFNVGYQFIDFGFVLPTGLNRTVSFILSKYTTTVLLSMSEFQEQTASMLSKSDYLVI